MTTEETEEVLHEAINAFNLPWAGVPPLTAGLNAYFRATTFKDRMKRRSLGVPGRKFEFVVTTANENEFIVYGTNDKGNVRGVADRLNGQPVTEIVTSLLHVDLRLHTGVSEALMSQWREVCHAFSGAVPGDTCYVHEPYEVELADGAGLLDPDQPFEVVDVMFDEDHNLLGRAHDGELFSVPAAECGILARRKDRSGRMRGCEYVYTPRGYVMTKEGEYL